MLSTWIMDFLLILGLYGTDLPPVTDAAHVDYNGDGSIDLNDLLDHLNLYPSATDFNDNSTMK